MHAMPSKDRHNKLIKLILSKALRIKLDIYESAGPFYILSSKNYEGLQEIKQLIKELEELDSLIDNQADNPNI